MKIMNMVMDNSHHQHPQSQAPATSPHRGDLRISTTPPTNRLSPIQHHNHNNNLLVEKQMSPTTNLTVGKSTLKRSFDVAFLMMPDERIKQRQHIEKHSRFLDPIDHSGQYPTDLSPRSQQLQQQAIMEESDIQALQELRRYPQISIRSPRIYDDPTVIIPADNETLPIKSAFTKVSAMNRLESPVEPASPLSPDQLSCPSMSPPIATTPPRTNSGNGCLNSNINCLPPNLNPNIVYQSFRPEYQLNGAFQSVNQIQALQAQRLKQQLFYRPPLSSVQTSPNSHSHNSSPGPEFLPAAYASFPFPTSGAGHPFAVAPPEIPRIVQNPAAAAILSTLIPPTLASTFSLTAQNVCAKCNISFRMTSDLVYHMRSHHKSEVACDPNRRKREEKLKCPVCQESFRERHHLTRHMTAHQDKESDQTPNNSPNDEIINVTSSPNSRHHMPRGNLTLAK